MEGKRAVVTGGAQGIGAAIARRFAEEGARVAVLDLNEQAASATLPAPHIGIACDVSDTASVDAAFARVKQAFGGIDVLVNNAAIGSAPGDGMDIVYAAKGQRQAQIDAGETPTAFIEQIVHCNDDAWDRVLSVSLDGVFRCSRAAARLMIEEGVAGNIVNISSTAATEADGPLPYVVAKAGVVGMTRALARELGDRGIRVNAVSPGVTRTPIHDGLPDDLVQSLAAKNLLKRVSQPEEVASAVAFLAGSDGSFCTGSVVTVNAGHYFD